MTDEPENIVLQHLIAIRADITAIRADIADLANGQTVLGQMILRLETDMVQVKRLLVHLQHRLRAQS